MEIKKEWIESEKERVSRRVYIDRKLENNDINTIKEFLKELNEESKFNFQLVEDCSKFFKGFSASYGMIKGLNSCVALVGNKNIDNYKQKIGYYGEMLVLEATSMNLGTCWIGGTYDKKECEKYINLKEDEELVCVIAIGYVLENKTLKEKFISRFNKSKKTFDDILLESDTKPPAWVISGINSVMIAPSAVNRKPVGYSYKDNIIKAYITKENYGFEEVDLGISVLHFQIGAKSNGYNSKINFNNREVYIK